MMALDVTRRFGQSRIRYVPACFEEESSARPVPLCIGNKQMVTLDAGAGDRQVWLRIGRAVLDDDREPQCSQC